MQIIRHFYNATTLASAPPLALAIGNFDGVHMGHQALLSRLLGVANAQGLIPAVMTFEPHPREFFNPQNAPARLSNLREKLAFFEKVGVRKVFVMRFDARFAAMSAQDFMTLLSDNMRVRAVLVGEDFKFGAQRTGSVATFREHGFALISLPHVMQGAVRVSSTAVRQALAAGDLTQAAILLGRPYSISGKVVHGAKRGRQLGFPTANIHIRHERPPMTGVYAVKLDGLYAVANFGVRPTISGVPKLSLEVHLLDFVGDLYGKHVHVTFLHKIRDEQKFESLDALKAHIATDVATAEKFFSTVVSA